MNVNGSTTQHLSSRSQREVQKRANCPDFEQYRITKMSSAHGERLVYLHVTANKACRNRTTSNAMIASAHALRNPQEPSTLMGVFAAAMCTFASKQFTYNCPNLWLASLKPKTAYYEVPVRERKKMEPLFVWKLFGFSMEWVLCDWFEYVQLDSRFRDQSLFGRIR